MKTASFRVSRVTRRVGIGWSIAVVAAACGGGAPAMVCQPWGSPEDVAARPSPYDSAMATVGAAALKICYSRPATRGRLVFGGLVPYDTLWRTGANEPTILHLSADAEIAGMRVEAGDYSIYTVPSPRQWTVVVNAATSQWGLTRDEVGAGGNRFYNAYTEDVRAQEVGRAPIEVGPVDFTERLTAGFGPPTGSEIDLLLDWAATRITVPIRITGG